MSRVLLHCPPPPKKNNKKIWKYAVLSCYILTKHRVLGCSQIPAFHFNFKVFFIITVCTSVFFCFEMCEYIMLFLSRLEGIFHAYCVHSYFLWVTMLCICLVKLLWYCIEVPMFNLFRWLFGYIHVSYHIILLLLFALAPALRRHWP